jgi:hypothetical protein
MVPVTIIRAATDRCEACGRRHRSVLTLGNEKSVPAAPIPACCAPVAPSCGRTFCAPAAPRPTHVDG